MSETRHDAAARERAMPHPIASGAAVRPSPRNLVNGLMFGIAAVIHLVPLAGLAGSAGLQRLYGVHIVDPNLLILMQHRAVLFGLLGVLLLGAVRVPAWRPPALFAGIASAASFLVLVAAQAGHNDALQHVLAADVIALAALGVAAFCTATDPARGARAARPAGRRE